MYDSYAKRDRPRFCSCSRASARDRSQKAMTTSPAAALSPARRASGNDKNIGRLVLPAPLRVEPAHLGVRRKAMQSSLSWASRAPATRALWRHDAARRDLQGGQRLPAAALTTISTFALISSPRLRSRRRFLVAPDDLAHEIVRHHVALGEFDMADGLDPESRADGFAKPGICHRRQVGLRRIPVRSSRAFAMRVQEHLHSASKLSVLRLVEQHA